MIVTKTFPARNSFNNVFNDLFGTLQSNIEAQTKTSDVDVNILELENAFELSFNAPGRKKENFKVSVDNGLLTISYEFEKTEDATNKKFVRKEFENGNFKRSFNLDKQMNTDAIAAKYVDGVLNVFIPKKEEVKNNPKQISIQ